MIHRLSVLLAAICLTTAYAEVENVVVYSNPKEFAGWPANEGMWSWGDEMLVGFEVAAFSEQEGDHSVDRESHKRIVFARSLDGGKTWKAEEHPEIGSPMYLGDSDKYRQDDDQKPVPSPGGFDFSKPDFAMKLRGTTFYTSVDRGHKWQGPYLLPEFGYDSEARTSYIPTGKDSCLIFMTGRVGPKDGLRYARSCVLETTDGGKTFQFLSWLGEDIGLEVPKGKDKNQAENIFSIMPSAVHLEGKRYVCAVRQRIDKRKWTDIFESTDGGKSWTKISTLEKGSSNPATLVHLDGEKIAAVYGNRRSKPLGLAAKLSSDGGKTWSDEIVLRSDALKWDLGYTRAVRRPDGAIVSTYYYVTEDIPQNFIAATIWNPSSQDQPEEKN